MTAPGDRRRPELSRANRPRSQGRKRSRLAPLVVDSNGQPVAEESIAPDTSDYQSSDTVCTTDNALGTPCDRLNIVSDNKSATVLAGYAEHLDRSPLSANTRRAYRRQVARYLEWLEERPSAEIALDDPHARDFCVRDYRHALKEQRLSAASVNAALAAVDHLYRFVGLGPPKVQRDRLAAQAPRALDEHELRSVFRAAERCGRARDRAAVGLLALAGLRLSELAALDIDDLALSARKGTVTVRHGKGDATRSLPLSSEARTLLELWLRERPPGTTAALFVGPAGERLSTRALARVVERIGTAAGVELSPHVLRHTFVTRLVRSGADVVLVAELAGHRSLETTRRYALPTAEDRALAVEALPVER